MQAPPCGVGSIAPTSRNATRVTAALATEAPPRAQTPQLEPLAAAASGRRYRSADRAATAGFIGVTALDVTMVITITLAAPVVIWPIIVAAAASATRITFTARTLRSVLVD